MIKEEPFQSFDDSWDVINSYFKNRHLNQLVKHQIESYNNFIENQIRKTVEMFNPLIIKSSHDYIKEFKKYRLEIRIEFDNFYLYRPEIHENNGSTKLMFPNDARIRNFTYNSNMTLDMNITYYIRKGNNLEEEEIKKIKLSRIQFGKIPIMVKSSICILNQYSNLDHTKTKECNMDPGGYFIINGSEKTCLGQEKSADNKIYIFKSKENSKWSHVAEIKCVPSWKVISPKQIYMMININHDKNKSIYIQIPKIKKPIPLFILFRAIGITSDKEICKYILLNLTKKDNHNILKFLKESIEASSNYLNQEECIQYIKNNVIYTPINMTSEEGDKKKSDFTNDILNNDLFPHCTTKTEKIYLLGFMANKLIKCCLGYIKVDDRDAYENKRIELTGCLLNNLFRNYFNKVIKDIQKLVIREINNGSWKSSEDYTNIINLTNVYKIVKSSTIENGLKRALSTGDFGIKQLNSNKVGVAQVLNRMTYTSTLSHLRRVNTPIDKSGKLVEPRKLHGSSYGFLCPAETPEGQSVGIVKNLSYMTCITNYSDSNCIYDYVINQITNINDEDKTPEDFYNKVKIILNGRWIGVTDDPINIYNMLKTQKYKGIIHIYTSISFDYNNKIIYIINDSGRLVRPLYKVKNNKLLINRIIRDDIKTSNLEWTDLLLSLKLKESVIEYIDNEEQKNSMICMDLKTINNSSYNYTHCEIHPSTIFGVLASCIPFPENNQSPRNTYQCAMGKQAIGIYASNFKERMDKTAYILNYPAKPLVETRIMDMLKINKLSSGNQTIVAIMTHTGYNQEDSILVNKGSIDRGLFHATIYHTEKDEDKKVNGEEELRIKPNTLNTKNIKFGNYNKLNSNGLIDENELIEDKDIIMGKVITIKNSKNDENQNKKYEDHSKSYKTNEECYIDKNYVNRNGDGYIFCKIKIRATRIPTIGDKFSSRHGQKGTIGHIINEEDMPFTKNGMRPDIIINPHAIPSRMTIAQLKETLLGKLLLELGLYGDGTSFGNINLNSICNNLQEHNYESKGNEILYDGKSGEQIQTSIFIGPAYYQRLKHMVTDKQHSRCIGPMVNFTRQPPEGRSRDGGLRFGEMERDCMISHGSSLFTKDRIYEASDKYSLYICNHCGIISPYNSKEKIHKCNICENKCDFSYIKIPYSFKLLLQELMAMNVVPRLITSSV
uniref:DNA-directed RNA polymerase subunit beta n=1 Tax=Florenciella sp. virus SA2 TaxID=3240092 RepID=A0AB39JBT0_9VIRU